MDNNSNGYIRLSRKFFKHFIWMTARTYNDGEAWLDLIQSARFEASEITSRVGECYEITWGRGQYPASLRFLAKKWQWSEKKVRRFLRILIKNDMIAVDSSQRVNVITLLNYDLYNPISVNEPNGTTKTLENNGLRASRAHEGTTLAAGNVLYGNELEENRAQHGTQVPDFGHNLGHNPGTNIKEREINNILLTTITENACEKSLLEQLRQSKVWLNAMCKRFRRTPAEISALIGEFAAECICSGEDDHESLKKLKWHFFNWLNRRIGTVPVAGDVKFNTYETQRHDRFSKRRGTDPSFNRPEDYTGSL